MKQSRSAFTLIEVSVVLAIVGLLIGGIIAGTTLMKNQRLRSVTAQATQYMIAARQFKQQYGYLPGDFPQAQDIWGSVAGGGAGCNLAQAISVASVNGAVCNGDGNGVISNYTLAPTTLGEAFRAWVELANAKLVVGKFTGIPGNAGGTGCCTSGYTGMVVFAGGDSPSEVGGTNVPKGPLPNTQFAWVGYVLPSTRALTNAMDWTLFPGDYANALVFGSPPSVGIGYTRWTLTPADAYELDTKVDDGFPSTGTVLANASTIGMFSSDCANQVASSPAGALYNLSNTRNECTLFFLSAFGASKDARM